jgi:hypothetical protein
MVQKCLFNKIGEHDNPSMVSAGPTVCLNVQRRINKKAREQTLIFVQIYFN